MPVTYRRALGVAAAVTVSALVLVGCSSGSEPASTTPEGTAAGDATTTPAPEPIDVSLRLDWTWGAEHTGYVVAQQLGYYEDAGLNVSIDEGEGSAVTATLLGTGEADFGVISAGEVLTAVSKDIPIESIATVVQKSPTSIIYDKDVFTPTSLADLSGHTLGVVTESSTYKEWQAVAKLAGIDTSSVKEVAVGSAVVQALLTKQVDAAVGWTFNQALQATVEGANVGTLLFADLGLNIPNSTLAVNKGFAAEHPEAVAAFVDATRRGWEYTIENPDEALKILFGQQPEIDQEYNTQKLPLVIDLMGDEFGAFDADSWGQLKSLYADQGILAKDVELDGDVYTAQYLG